ncbi:MAG: S8 family peptidase [Bryobacteraceae bacterium]
MALSRDHDQHPHIPVAREPGIEPERRGRRMVPRPIRRPQDRSRHGSEVQAQLTASLMEIEGGRRAAGIDPSRLMVLEFDSLNFELGEELVERLGARLVDEREERDGKDRSYRAVLQFDSAAAIQEFQSRLTAYREGLSGAPIPAWRRDLLDSLQRVRAFSREDRLGDRLRAEGYPEPALFLLDADLWHPGDPTRAREIVQQFRDLCRANGGRVADDLRTSSLLLLKIEASTGLAEILLGLDLVARVDLPPRVAASFQNISRELNWPNPAAVPDETDPMACVIDSGVIAGHPLLANWVIEERDFDTGEDTPADMNGHGTAVAGLVVYGDIAECVEANRWEPRVRICSAKVLRNQPNPLEPDRPAAEFPGDSPRRIESVIREAIEYFHEQGCRVFNLSVGDQSEAYADGRQFPWAEMLDELARELDVVIVVSVGNNAEPGIPQTPPTRNRFRKAVRDQVLQHRLLNPATAALALTVGSLARHDGAPVGTLSATAGAPAGGPSPFTRSGPGYALRPTSKGIKPDLADYGGNYALQALTPAQSRWAQSPALGEPSLHREYVERALRMCHGTSFATPHVTHAAAVAQVALRDALGREPFACLIRAVLGASAETPDAPRGWYSGEKARCALIGYGRPAVERVAWSLDHDARLVAMDHVEENRFHLYHVPVPPDFLAGEGARRITIALAYDPPVRGSRKLYMARTMFFTPAIGLTRDEAIAALSKFDGERDEAPKLPGGTKLEMKPGERRVAYSTLQVRRAEWGCAADLPNMRDRNGDSALLVAVFCQRRFAHDPLDISQRYGLVADFWHEDPAARIYHSLRNSVRQVVRQQVRS